MDADDEHIDGACIITVGVIVVIASNNFEVIDWGGDLDDDDDAKDESVVFTNCKANGFNKVIVSPGTKTE